MTNPPNTVAQMRADIKSVLTTLDASSNIGVVHDYERWGLQLSDLLDILLDPTDDKIRSWMIVYQGFTTSLEAYDYSQIETTSKSITVRDHRWMIRGVWGLDDTNASEKSFATLVETLVNALDANETLHDQDRYWGDTPTSPASCETFEVRNFAGVLCHVAEITLTISGIHVGGS